VKFGRDLKKFSSGYNLRDLWIGSEGMLGVVTRATLKLIPAPRSRQTYLAAFARERAVLESVQELLSDGSVQPSILEFLDRLSVKGAEGCIGRTLFPESPASPLLLVEVDGHPAQVLEDAVIIEKWLGRNAITFLKSNTEEEAEELWQVRRQCSGAMFKLANSKLNQDVVVPIRREADLVDFIATVREETGLPIAVFGHAGDGNLHVNVMYDRSSMETREIAAHAVKMVMEEVVALGGSISGEHGIGLAKTAYTELEFGDAEFATMKAIKKALDPRNILNPGKLFETFEPWRHEPVDVQLPWDTRDPG
jgi:glycolate oxidase